MPYDPYDPRVRQRIEGDLQQIRDLAEEIKDATHSAQNLLLSSKVDNYEWEREMDRIHDAMKKIRWVICDKRGRFEQLPAGV